MKNILSPFVFLFLSFLIAAQERIPVAHIRIVKTASAPVIDGRLDDETWKTAAKTAPFGLFNTPKEAKFATIGYLAFDDVNLYIGFDASDPDILKWYHPSGREFDGDVWMDDCLEIYLGEPSDPLSFFQFVVNYDGVGFDQARHFGGTKWNGIWRCAVSRHEKGWSAEFEIPLYTIGITSSVKTVRMNLCREKYILPTELTSWSCAYGDFHHTERFGIVDGFSLSAPQIVLTDFHAPTQIVWGTNRFALAARNDSEEDWQGTLVTEDFAKNQYHLISETPLRLKPGERRSLEIPFNAESGRKYRLSFGVRDASGKIRRHVFRNFDIPDALRISRHSFIMEEGESTLSVLLLSAPNRAKELECRIVGPATRRIVLRALSHEIRFLPPAEDLPPGEYTVSYILRDAGGAELVEKRPLKITSSPWK